MPTSVVTGGAGFLGSHLCEALLAKGQRVVCVDNLETGSLANIEHLRDDAFVFLPHDVTTHIEIAEPVDFVYHLASPASPIDYLRLPLQTLKVGSAGTHNALGLAKVKRARFLLASTSEVYGDPQVHPQPETYWGHVNPIGPRGVYDEAKRYAEALTMAYHRQQGVDTAIVRIFNTYGAAMRPHDGRAIPTFLRQALEEKQLTVFGDGSQTRSFCFVDDLVRGLISLAESGEHLPVNIGNPDEKTLLELAETIVRDDRLVEPDRVRGAAGRRSPGAPARHHAREAAARLGARGGARGGPAPDDRVARAGTGTCVRRRRRFLPSSASQPGLPRRRRRRATSASGSSTTDRFSTASRSGVPAAAREPREGHPRQPLVVGRPGVQVAKRRPQDPSDPADPAYDWTAYDAVVKRATANGQQVVFYVARNASVGQPGAGLERGARRTPATSSSSRWRPRSATAAPIPARTARTLPRVASWIAWNEPNNPVFLKPQFAPDASVPGGWVIQSARDYARICNAVVQGVKSVQPTAKVACGVTAPRGNNNPNSGRPSVSPLAFARALRRAGASGFDAYAHHPYYGAPTETPSTPPPPGANGRPSTAVTLGNLEVLIAEVTRLWGNKRIWITEYGYQTNPTDKIVGVSWAKQAQYLKEAIAIARKHKRIDMFIWFLMIDETRNDGWQSGLIGSDLVKKPAFNAFKQMAG